MGHSHGPETIITVISPPQRSMNHHGSGYYDHIIYCILCYPIVAVTSNYTVPYTLDLAIKISG